MARRAEGNQPTPMRASACVLFACVVVLLGGCQADPGSEHSEDHSQSADLAHIHGLGINPADGELYVGSHHGIFRVSGKGKPEQIANRTQDFMGFTVLGPDHFLGSGHPGPGDTSQPPHVGLIESTDAAKTWRSVSLSGEADFHALEAQHGRVYGYDSQSGQLMVSDDKRSWDRRAGLPLADIAVSPDDPDVLLATTEQGPARSADGGRTFAPIERAPLLYFLDWADTKRLVGVAPDGALHTSSDGGAHWTRQGQVPSQPQALLAHGTADVYVATADAIHRSTDNGQTFRIFQALG